MLYTFLLFWGGFIFLHLFNVYKIETCTCRSAQILKIPNIPWLRFPLFSRLPKLAHRGAATSSASSNTKRRFPHTQLRSHCNPYSLTSEQHESQELGGCLARIYGVHTHHAARVAFRFFVFIQAACFFGCFFSGFRFLFFCCFFCFLRH